MSEKLEWDDYSMKCGHPVDRNDFYIDYDGVIRMRYICEEGCETPWIKLMKAPMPDDSKFDSDPFEKDYVPRTYVWDEIHVGDILPFKCEGGSAEDVEDYEVAYKLYMKRNASGTSKKIFYLRPVCDEEYVMAEFWEDGSIHFMPGIEEPFTTNHFQGWTEEELEIIKKRVMYFKENDKRNSV